MKRIVSIWLWISMTVMCVFGGIGYATVADNLNMSGDIHAKPNFPDLYIVGYTPAQSAGVTVEATSGTVLVASVDGRGTATFQVTVKNISDKVYVYERVIDGIETGIEGVYQGTAITYKVSGVAPLQEISTNGGTLTFNVEITVPAGVTTDCYVLKFNFIEKTGTDILPGNDEHDITFKYRNGNPDTVIKLHENEFIPRPANPARVGYNFTGWYTDESCTKAWNFDADRVSGPTTLYAGWESAYSPTVEYTVTFKKNNGEPDSSASYEKGTLIPLPAIPVRDGFDFIGWYTDEEWTTAWNFDTDKIEANMTLYAGWEVYVPPVPPDCNITFIPNNGEPSWTETLLTGNFIERPATPVRDGYDFIGWYTDESCTNAWNFETTRVTTHLTLYGGWEKKVEYTVTFNKNNGEPNTSVKVSEGELIPRPDTPTRDGYVFIGWYSDSTLKNAWNLDTDRPSADMTLYAGWEEYVAPDPDKPEFHSGILGIVEALLSKATNCLNQSNVIFNAVISAYNSGKRPKEDAPVVHSSVNSVSGGTMSAIALSANSYVDKNSNIHFLFEADPDPAHRQTRMALYLYYGDDLDKVKDGERIAVYKQIVSRGSDGVWYADGTYLGHAVVGDYFGGGNNGKDVRTIDAYSWQAGELPL